MGLHFSKQHLIKLGIFSVVVFSFFPLFLSLYVIGVLTIAFYLSVFTMSWDLLFGYSGEVNFGPTFLIGIGAYTAALLNINTSLPVAACIIFGTIAAVVAGLLLVAPALRLRGPYFGLVTLVSVLLLEEIITVFAQYTGGEIGISLGGVLSLSGIINYYYALIFVVITALILIFITSSPLGLILQASAQDPIEAESLGFNIIKYKILAFVLSAFFSGLSGALLVFYFGTASVSIVVSMAVVLQIIIAVIVGGRRTIVGPILGALFIVLTSEWLQFLGQLDYVAVSILALIVMILIPDGIVGIFLDR